MKLGIAYSTRDRVDLTEQTYPSLMGRDFKLHWVDGSETDAGQHLPLDILTADLCFPNQPLTILHTGVRGGADAAIVFKLTTLLQHPNNYTHIGLVENDVLLDPDWLEPTLALFDRGRADGLEVGAVSARSYVDRVLVQRDGYAVMHNLGAGMVIYTREAAQLVLDSFRTHWAPHIRQTFMRLSGIDIARYWAFRGNDQWVTSDWGYDAILASRGLASLALTPARCDMIGQVPPLAEQGLQLVTNGEFGPGDWRITEEAFALYRTRLASIRNNTWNCNSPVEDIDPCIGGERIVFPHLAPQFGATYAGDWRLQWSQGFSPFAYRAGEGGASLTAPCYGTCSFLVSGGTNGARITAADSASGYKMERDIGPESATGIVSFAVPGNVTYREITLTLTEGAVFYGYSSNEEQPWHPHIKFDYSTLPPV